MALKSYALTTVARLKTFLDISTADDDTLLESIVNGATEWIEKYCQRRFKQTTYTSEKIDSDGSEVLFLKHFPVDETTAINLDVRTSGANEDEWEDVDTEDYFVDWNAGIIKSTGQYKWIKGVQKYRATYKAGFNFDNAAAFLSDTEAGDLEIGMWKLCGAFYNSRRGDARVQSEKIGSYAVTFASIAFEDDPTIGSVLNRYRKEDSVLGTMSPLLY